MNSWLIVFAVAGCIFPFAFVLCSYLVARRALFEAKVVRIIYFLVGVFFVAGSILLLPFVPQPRWHNLTLRLVLGIPLSVLGLIFRFAPLVYFKRKKTSLNLGSPSALIQEGPYAVVRHPQYASGVVLLIGWFIAWGGLYSLAVLPLIILVIYLQALIEEKFLLEKHFGEEYRRYRQRVGMFIPRVRRP